MLEDQPETFDGLRMNCADDVLLGGVVDDSVRIPLDPKTLTTKR